MRLGGWAAVTAMAALGLVSGAARAGACDSTACALVTRGAGGALPRHALRIDLSFRYADQTRPFVGSEPAADVVRPKVDFEHGLMLAGYHREVGGRERFLQCDLAYGLSSRATAILSLPLFTQRAYDISHGGSFAQNTDTQGFGDLLLGVQYGLLSGPEHRLAARAGVKLPTGDFKLINPYDHSINDPTIQPGTGSVDFVGAADFSRLGLLGLDWTVSGSYQRNTTNDIGYRFGDDAIASLTLARPVVGKLAGSFQVKYWHEGRNQFLDRPVPSTGATILYLTPGLRVAMPALMTVYGFVQVPAYRYVNEAQLTPKVAVLFGVSKTF